MAKFDKGKIALFLACASVLGPVNTKYRIKNESEVNEEKENRIEFVIASKNTSKTLNFSKKPFDVVARFIQNFVKNPRRFSIRFRAC